MQDGFVEVDGLSIYYRRYAGAAPTIVLAHGWGSSLEHNWLETGWIEALRKHRTVVAIDVRGHGLSSKPVDQALYTYHALKRDVLGVMDALEIERSSFLGYSMGAFMGAALLRDHSHRFSSMVLGGIGDETDASAAQGAAIADALLAPDDAVDAQASAVRAFVSAVPNHDLNALASSARAMWPDGYPRRLIGANAMAVQCKVLIVNGEKDRPYVDSADALAAALPSARHVRLPGADHLGAVTEPLFKDRVIEFLNEA